MWCNENKKALFLKVFVACVFIISTASVNQSAFCASNKDEPKPGTVSKFDGIEFVWIPSNSFYRGERSKPSKISDDFGGNEVFWEDEQPRRKVELTKGIWMQAHEITNAEFQAFVDETGYETDAERSGWSWAWDEKTQAMEEVKGLNWLAPGWETTSSQPVVCVSWNDVAAFVEWKNEQSEGGYRLPTEAEWESACRAGETKSFPWGNDVEDGEGWLNAADKGNFKTQGNMVPFPFDDGFAQVAEVGSFKPNEWGLYDMIGNVNEWCLDWYDERYYDQKSEDTDPKGPPSGHSHVVRGGSWFNYPARCRCAHRYGLSPEIRNSYVGFRLVREWNTEEVVEVD